MNIDMPAMPTSASTLDNAATAMTQGTDPVAMSTSVGSGDPCIMMMDSSSCSATAECTWFDNTAPADMKKPLFSEEFCHPVAASGGKIQNIPVTDWDACLNMDTCAAPCVMSTGAEMIPETDFCTPYFMDTNTTLIEECVNADQAKCSGQCKWRKGKDVAANNDLINGADLFGANFCHPPTTESWEKDLSKCITLANKDACAQAKCMWSTGKEFQGEDDFCVPR